MANIWRNTSSQKRRRAGKAIFTTGRWEIIEKNYRLNFMDQKKKIETIEKFIEDFDGVNNFGIGDVSWSEFKEAAEALIREHREPSNLERAPLETATGTKITIEMTPLGIDCPSVEPPVTISERADYRRLRKPLKRLREKPCDRPSAVLAINVFAKGIRKF
jgi:hypothetical protein